MKNLTRSVLCAVTAAYLTITGSVIAGGYHGEHSIKIIQEDDGVTVHAGDGQVTVIPSDVLSDKDQLQSYLGDLDEKTQEMVLELLTGMGEHDGNYKVLKLTKFLEKMRDVNTKVMVIGDEHVDLDEHHIMVTPDVHVDPQVHVKKLRNHGIEKHVFIDIQDDEAHKKTILSLLNKGEFTQEQLDEIQQLLDSKR